MLDAGGLAALEKFIASCHSNNIELLIADLQFQPLKALARAGIRPIEGQLNFSPTLAEALDMVSNR
jgi:SulP family sulfate permease